MIRKVHLAVENQNVYEMRQNEEYISLKFDVTAEPISRHLENAISRNIKNSVSPVVPAYMTEKVSTEINQHVCRYIRTCSKE